MKFTYELDSENNGVTLLGIEGECPKELDIPAFLEVDNQKMTVTGIHFGSPLPSFFTEYGKGVTCEVIHIPETVHNVSFGYNKYIKEVFLPNSLSNIKTGCFTHCENLKVVHLPNNLKSMGRVAFRNCTRIEEISLPSKVIEIGFGCFENCCSLKKIVIPSGLNELKINVFKNCTNLCEVITQNPNVTFEPTTFIGCKSLKKIDGYLIENGLLYNLEKTELYTYLGNDKSDGNIIIPESVCEIGNGFNSMADLVSIDLSKTQIKIIYRETFKDCINLEKVVLPSCVQLIDYAAFKGCTKLSEIKLPNSIEKIGISCFENCGIKEIVLPKNIEKIPENAFKDCKELFNVSIPHVKTIYYSAFENCDKIWHVVISEGHKENLSQIFKNHNAIGFNIVRFSNTPIRKTGAYTHGRLRPCPYCGSDNVNTYCDGTAMCNTCKGEYTYQY